MSELLEKRLSSIEETIKKIAERILGDSGDTEIELITVPQFCKRTGMAMHTIYQYRSGGREFMFFKKYPGVGLACTKKEFEGFLNNSKENTTLQRQRFGM